MISSVWDGMGVVSVVVEHERCTLAVDMWVLGLGRVGVDHILAIRHSHGTIECTLEVVVEPGQLEASSWETIRNG